jgi:hypothetical protein
MLPDGLETLNISSSFFTDSQLTLPPLPNSLRMLEIIGTELTSLPVLPSSLRELTLNVTKMTTLAACHSNLRFKCLFADVIHYVIELCVSVFPRIASICRYFPCG